MTLFFGSQSEGFSAFFFVQRSGVAVEVEHIEPVSTDGLVALLYAVAIGKRSAVEPRSRAAFAGD